MNASSSGNAACPARARMAWMHIPPTAALPIKAGAYGLARAASPATARCRADTAPEYHRTAPLSLVLAPSPRLL